MRAENLKSSMPILHNIMCVPDLSHITLVQVTES